MTKEQMVKYLSTQTGLPVVTISDIITAYHEMMIEALRQDGHYTITGFGTIHVSPVSRRTGYDIKTGKKVPLSASKRISFRASPKLKNALKEG